MENKPNFKALLTFYTEKESGNYAPFSTGLRVQIEFPFQNKRIYTNVNFNDSELIFPGDIISSDLLLFFEEK